jgi:hypothetical protein
VVRVAGVLVDRQQQLAEQHRDVLEAHQGSEAEGAGGAQPAIAARVGLIIEAAISRVGCQRWPFG